MRYLFILVLFFFFFTSKVISAQSTRPGLRVPEVQEFKCDCGHVVVLSAGEWAAWGGGRHDVTGGLKPLKSLR